MAASKPPELEPWVKYIKDAKKTGKLDNKAFWREVGTEYIKRYPEEAYRMMNPQIYEILRDNLERRKVETVLDVGCGFGRMTNLILTSGLFTNVKRVVSLDISDGMLKEARKTVPFRLQHRVVRFLRTDFEEDDMYSILVRDPGMPSFFDLVISAEVMTSIPKQEEDRVKRFVDRMCGLSKKYVVNVDWFWHESGGRAKLGDPVLAINNYHKYDEHYESNSSVLLYEKHKIKGVSEWVFVARLK